MSENSTTVHVDLGPRSYDIEIGSGVLSKAASFLTRLRHTTHVVAITDTNVEDQYATRLADTLTEAGIDVDVVVVDPGEETKSVEMVNDLWRQMLAAGADRKTVVAAVGGGVIGDLAGFVAATYARGLSFLQVPTTLLAHVDSSVGGKVGVNLPRAKNMVGAFWQPDGVLIDTDVLDTLPDRQFAAGMAEVVKYGVILDADFFEYLENHIEEINNRDPSVLKTVIARCCQLKADVVANDERETTGLRAVLNYGHTFCHAIEAETGYGKYLHGEAVSIGMLCASRLAELMGRVDNELTCRQLALLTAFRLPTSLPEIEHDKLISAMQRDKKVEHGRLRFVLPTRMGHVELVSDVDEQLVRQALAAS